MKEAEKVSWQKIADTPYAVKQDKEGKILQKYIKKITKSIIFLQKYITRIKARYYNEETKKHKKR